MRDLFVVDRPLTERDPFYGREELIRRLTNDLAAGRRILMLFGKRHIGKTSLLNQLDLHLGGRYVTHQIAWAPHVGAAQTGRGGRARGGRPSTPALMTQLAAAIVTALGEQEEIGRSLDNPDAALLRLVRSVQGAEAADPSTVHLCCIDSVPAADLASRGWEAALAALTHSLAAHHALALLVVVEGRAQECDLHLDELPIVRYAAEALSVDDTGEMLLHLTEGAMHLDQEALRRVHMLSGGEPVFVQLFGRALHARRPGYRWVTLSEVDGATERILGEATGEFEATWDGITPIERVIVCVFAEHIGNQGLATAADVAMHLRRQRVEMSATQINGLLDRLVARDAIEELGGRTFRIRNGLFYLWLRQTQSVLAAVRRAPGVHQTRPKTVSPWRRRHVDWVSLSLWVVALSLLGAIVWMWRSRESQVTWTAALTAPPSASGATPQTAPPTPDRGVVPGSIVYVAKDEASERWAVYRMRPDGSDPTRLTSGAANDTSPVASPDGRRVAFVSDRDGNREVYVMNADGNDQLNLTRNAADDWSPSWSPDGKRLVWASFRDRNWELYTMDASGAGAKRLTSTGAADYGPSWSPDGKQIAFVSDRSGNLDIYIIDIASRATARFTEDPATDQAPSWSPDGLRILWESYREGNMEIYAAPVQGTASLRNLSEDSTANDHGGWWSPDGRYLVWYSNRDKGWDIYRLDTQTGERLNLTSSPALEQWPNWSP